MARTSPTWHSVKQSALHGNGVFAATDIPAGTHILQYCGRRITPEQADAMFPVNPDDPFHTFFFALSCGKVIDGGDRGNDARWINHSCAPNCETQESESGKSVYIVALRDIAQGEELFYDYGLVIDGRVTRTLREQYKCLCGADDCRGTMLALPSKKKKKRAADEAGQDRPKKAKGAGKGKRDAGAEGDVAAGSGKLKKGKGGKKAKDGKGAKAGKKGKDAKGANAGKKDKALKKLGKGGKHARDAKAAENGQSQGVAA